MPWYDLPLERLREYRTSTAEPAGLDQWWAGSHRSGAAPGPAPADRQARAGHLPAGRGVRRRVLRRGRRPDQGVVPAAAGGHAGHADDRQVHRLRRRARRPGRACPAARARLRAVRHGQPRAGGPLVLRRHRGWRRGAGELAGHDPRDRQPGHVLLHADVHRRGAGGGRGAGPVRRGEGRRQRPEPGRRARAGRGGPARGRGVAVPRRRPVPVRHPAGDHAGAARAVHRGAGVPGPERQTSSTRPWRR